VGLEEVCEVKQLWAVAINELKVEFADRSTWFSFLVLPLIFTVVIGVATQGFGGDPNADPRVPAALVDEDGGPLAAAFTEALAQSKAVRFQTSTEPQALDQLKAKEVLAVIVLPPGFSADLEAGRKVTVPLHLTSANTDGQVFSAEVQAAIAKVSGAVLAAQVSVDEAEARRPFASAAERAAYFQAALKLAGEAPAAAVDVEAKEAPAAAALTVAGGYALSSPGQLVTWVLATLLAGAGALVAERRMGTLRRLLTTPAAKGSILGGKIVGRFAMGLMQMALMIGFGQGVLGVKWGNSPLALALVAACFGLAATALALFLSTLVRTEQQAGAFTSLGVFLLAPLGGAWVPLEITPPAFQTFAQLLPTTWAMRGFTDVIVRGQGPQGVWLECGVLLGYAVVFFALGLWRFRYE
jgi:ABC-2 type transport system permease protein